MNRPITRTIALTTTLLIPCGVARAQEAHSDGGVLATHTVEQLHAAVDASAALSSHTDDTIDNRSVNGSHATMRGRLHTPQGDVPVDVELSQVGDHWYVDAVIVSGVPAL